MTKSQAALKRTAIPDSTNSQATRHLCAGVYLDREFLDLVIRKVCLDARHWVAPSYGFDLVPVVRHAWQARALEAVQQALVLLTLGLGWAWNPPATIAACCAVGLVYLLPRVLRAAPSVLQAKAGALTGRLLHHSDSRLPHSLRERARILGLGVLACLLLLLLPLVVAAYRKISLAELTRSVAVLLLAVAVVAAVCGAVRQLALSRLHGAASLRPTRLTQREAVIDSQQFHSYVIYQRHKKPDSTTDDPLLRSIADTPQFFVGSGELLHRWLPPLVIPLLRSGSGSWSERAYDGAPFEAHALVEHLREAVTRLRDDPDPKMRLPGLHLADRVYIAESDVATDRSFLAPLSQADLNAIIDNPHSKENHFLQTCVSVSGELVTSVFLRVSINGGSLTLDCAASALTRTPPDYHFLGGYRRSEKVAITRSIFRSLGNVPSEIGHSWRLIQVPMMLAGAARACTDHTLISRPEIGIGPQVSIREMKSTFWNEAQHDQPHLLSHIKIIETCLLHATEDFLKVHHVDLSQFSTQASTIITANVLNMGKMNIDNSAVGDNAQTNNNNQRDDPGGSTP